MAARTLPRVNRRLWTLPRLATIVVATTMLAACDTGDGKTLQDFDPADYPSQTEPPTSVSSSDGFDALDVDGEQHSANSQPDDTVEAFQLFAPWQPGEEIDPLHTCDGDDIAPALSWGAVPTGTVEVAVVLVDDSAVSDGQPFVHWAIGGLDPAEIALAEGDLPVGAVQALNFFGDVGYGGPCPPPGDDAHLYRLTAFALGEPLDVADGTPATEFLDAIARVTIGTTDLSATYQR